SMYFHALDTSGSTHCSNLQCSMCNQPPGPCRLTRSRQAGGCRTVGRALLPGITVFIWRQSCENRLEKRREGGWMNYLRNPEWGWQPSDRVTHVHQWVQQEGEADVI